ncbi:MAG: transposase, partial [Roseiarcus sp.]
AYASLAGDAKMSGKIRLAYCLVHARRNFVKVHKTTNSPFAREVIERIGAVYAIEEGIRGLDADQRRAVRQAETKPLMEALKARLEAVKDGISRQSTLIKAIDYLLERWEGLTAFLDDGRLEPDTNTVERSIRPIATGLSLCTSFSSVWKHWKWVCGRGATRATFTGDRRSDGLRLQVA